MFTVITSPPDATTLERIRTSPVAWVLAGVLLLVAACIIIRLLEFDLINEQTPNQDDPLAR